MMSCPSKTSNAKNRIQKLLMMILRFATPLSLFLCFGNFTLEEVAEKKSKEEGENALHQNFTFFCTTLLIMIQRFAL